MARPKTSDGRRVTVSLKLSEAEAAVIDTARGTEERGVWLRRAALAAAERQLPPSGHVDRQARAVAENFAAARGDCPHPKARVIKGLCGACGTHVGKAN